MQEEFYAIAFRKKLYGNFELLGQDLDKRMQYYNNKQPLSGRYCYGKITMETFIESIPQDTAKLVGKIRPSMTYNFTPPPLQD
jgi:hypothetical protein